MVPVRSSYLNDKHYQGPGEAEGSWSDTHQIYSLARQWTSDFNLVQQSSVHSIWLDNQSLGHSESGSAITGTIILVSFRGLVRYPLDARRPNSSEH